MKVPFLDLARQNEPFLDDFTLDFKRIAISGKYVSGESVKKFESTLSKTLNGLEVVACNSGTSAIFIILQSLGIGPGDEVIVPAMTFVATAEAVIQAGAIPVIGDINPLTRNLDVAELSKLLTQRTKAVVFVHLHGNMSGIKEVSAFAKTNNLALIEDAAQALGATLDGRRIGEFGDAAALSFYPGKNLGALGEGGAVVTSSYEICHQSRLIRNWGSEEKYKHVRRGGNYRMDELQAALLTRKLQELPKYNQHRRLLASIYNKELDLEIVNLPIANDGSVYHIYSILLEKRDDLREFLGSSGVETGIHYPQSLDQISSWSNYLKGNLSPHNSQLFASRNLSLPISDHHTLEEIGYVVDRVNSYLAKQ